MNIYIFNIVVVLLIAFVYPIRYDYGMRIKSRPIRPVAIFTFVLLTLEMGLRGEFDVDTVNYYRLFQNSATENAGDVLARARDFSYFFYSLWFTKITDSYTLFLLSLAAIEAFGYTYFMTKESKSLWLSLLILFCSGSFYTGFNIMRELLAASMVCNCYKFVCERKFAKYALSVLLISTVHLSALFMLPFYFVTNIRWSGKSVLSVVVVVFGVSIILFQMADEIVSVTTLLLYEGYSDLSHFGMDEGISFAGTFKSVVLSSGVLLGYKYFNNKDTRDMMIYNGCVLNIIVAICGMKIFMIQRLTHYLIPCVMLGYPLILSRIRNNSTRHFWLVIIVLLFVASIINTIIDSDYYFYWENTQYRWQ